MDEAEDRSVGSDPECHDDDGDNGKSGALDQVAKGVAEVEFQGCLTPQCCEGHTQVWCHSTRRRFGASYLGQWPLLEIELSEGGQLRSRADSYFTRRLRRARRDGSSASARDGTALAAPRSCV